MKIHLKSSPRLPMYRPVNAISAKHRCAALQGVDSGQFLSDIGLTEADLDDPDLFVTIDQEFEFLRKLLKQIKDPTFGIFVAQQHHLASLGKWAVAVLYSSTGLEALKIALRYAEISHTCLQYELKISEEAATVRCNELMDLGECKKFIHEHEIFAVYQLCCLVLEKPLKLHALRFAFSEPENSGDYEAIFQCPVYFNAEYTGMRFDSEHLFKSLPRANPLLRKSYEKESEEMLQHVRSLESTTARVNRELLCLEDGLFPNIDYIAGRLHMSSRTLRRRLQAEETSCRHLIETFRKKKAFTLLENSHWSLDEIALKVGYSDTPSFCHAFKRWTGLRPSDYRPAV